MKRNKESMIRYVEALALAPSPASPGRRQRSVADPSQNSAAVDAGSVISFVAGMSDQDRSDVLNSTLLAQLHANTVADRFAQIEAWYQAYNDVLIHVGWDPQQFTFTEYDSGALTLNMSNAVVEILGAVASGDEIAAVTAALNALKQDGGALTLFSQNSTSTDFGNFQMGAASDAGGPVTLSYGAFHFTATFTDARFLWFDFPSASTHLFKATQDATLDEDVYATVREAIILKLGDRATTFVADLSI